MKTLKLGKLPLALSLTWPVCAALACHPASAAEAVKALAEVTVHANRMNELRDGAITVDLEQSKAGQIGASDTARLLGDVPGVALYGAGGVSSLPVIHGLADDRLRVSVDGMELVSACANHMNPALSYIDPTHVGSMQVFTGITPVSAGGDSIGGSIVVQSNPSAFSKSPDALLLQGSAGGFYRSNGEGRGGNVALTLASELVSLTYSGSTVEAANYQASQPFKTAIPSTAAVRVPGDREVGSTQFKSQNQSLAMALLHGDHLLELTLGQQYIPYQGFPNQRMDMTRNASDQVNLHYAGQYPWGSLEARIYNEKTRHTMNFLENKLSSSVSPGMPMDTQGDTTGLALKADVDLSARDTLKTGLDYQRYRLDDWWNPVSTTPGMMAPNVFWNIRDGQRDRLDIFGDWLANWNAQWFSQLGLRSAAVAMDAGKVQGYNSATGMMGYGDPANAASVPGAFNALDHKKTDHHIDLSALLRYTFSEGMEIEGGYSRKSRSPNLYERFAWSTNNNMVMNMINWVGDANGYVGNNNLKPETANTYSITADWHDASRTKWNLMVTSYVTDIEDYIDAVSCPTVGKTCPARTDKFVNLSFSNQTARLYGIDISGHVPLARSSTMGDFQLRGQLGFLRGKNETTGDNLYNIMPMNARLAVVQQSGNWINTAEVLLVDAKSDTSAMRNEVKTSGYGLLNVRSSHAWKNVTLNMGVDNLLDRFYAPPLGGAYFGERGAVWGIPVPGAGRSIQIGLNLKF